MVWAYKTVVNLFFPVSGIYCTKVYRGWISHQLGGMIPPVREKSVWIRTELLK